MLDREIMHLYPEFRVHIIKLLEDSENDFVRGVVPYKLRIAEGFRSVRRQHELYAQGRTAPGAIVTQLVTSLHSTGLACDLVPVDASNRELWAEDAKFARIGYYANRHGIQWGGNWHGFRDLPHVEPVHVDLLRMLQPAITWCAGAGLYAGGERPKFFHVPA